MKKALTIIISFALLMCIGACSGYEPIFHSINGDKKLCNKIYSQLYRSFKSAGNNADVKPVNIIIDVSKDKSATVKNSAGKILEYKISLDINIIFIDFLTNKEILNYKTSSSSSYKVRDQYFQTKKVENQTMQNLTDSIYRDLLIKMSEVMVAK